MIEFIYIVFFWLIVLQIGIFAFLNIPAPTSWRASLIIFINTNYYIRVVLRYHLWLCIISAFFFYDSYGTEKSFMNEIHNIKHGVGGSTAIGKETIILELRRWYLSYTILKVQRNEFITLLLIYVSIILNIYLGILHHMYTKRGKYHKEGQIESTSTKNVDATPNNFLYGIKWESNSLHTIENSEFLILFTL